MFYFPCLLKQCSTNMSWLDWRSLSLQNHTYRYNFHLLEMFTLQDSVTGILRRELWRKIYWFLDPTIPISMDDIFSFVMCNDERIEMSVSLNKGRYFMSFMSETFSRENFLFSFVMVFALCKPIYRVQWCDYNSRRSNALNL